MEQIGRMLLVIGIVITVIGAIFLFSGKIPFIGRLPGDFFVQRKNFTFYFPITTSILISLILTLLFLIINRR